MISTKPCRIIEIHKTKPGKTGSKKVWVIGINIFNKKKYEAIFPQESKVEAPYIN